VDKTDRVQFQAGSMMGISLFATAFRPALGTTQPPVQWVGRASSPGREANLHLIPRLRICGAIPPLECLHGVGLS
jgi:hypothetical protein